MNIQKIWEASFLMKSISEKLGILLVFSRTSSLIIPKMVMPESMATESYHSTVKVMVEKNEGHRKFSNVFTL